MEIVMIRHGQTLGNAQRRYIGVTDEPLSVLGRAQCARLEAPAAGRVYVSPMARCRETAAIVYPGQAQTVLDDLREYDFGAFENKNYDELCGRADYRAWIESRGQGNPTDGEDWRVFRCRCCRAFLNAVRDCMDEGVGSAAFVAHGGTFMAILERFGEPRRAFHAWQFQNAGGLVARADEKSWSVCKRLHVVRELQRLDEGAG